MIFDCEIIMIMVMKMMKIIRHLITITVTDQCNQKAAMQDIAKPTCR